VSNLPEPLSPPDCDLGGIEPPWEAFVQLAISTFGVSEQAARELVEEQRQAYWTGGRLG